MVHGVQGRTRLCLWVPSWRLWLTRRRGRAPGEGALSNHGSRRRSYSICQYTVL